MVFVLFAGAFEEVNSNNMTANATIKSMIESFGGKVNERYSKNTTHLLAGKNTDGGKIKDAGKRQGVEIIDLRRLEKLLLGKLTLIELNQLEKLTRDHYFKGNAYKPAGSPPSAETAVNAVSNDAQTATDTNASSVRNETNAPDVLR